MRTVLAVVAVIAIGAGLVYGAYGVGAQTTVTVEGGNDWFCDSSYLGGVCETVVTAGDTVTWVMIEGIHTVTECDSTFTVCPPSGGFNSDVIGSGDTFSHTFNSPGEYPYICVLHPSDMRGKITVLAAATPTPEPATATPAPHSGDATPTASPASGDATPAAVPATGGGASGSSAPMGAAMAIALGALLMGSAVLGWRIRASA